MTSSGGPRPIRGASRRLLTRASSRLPQRRYRRPPTSVVRGSGSVLAGAACRIAVTLARVLVTLERPRDAQRLAEFAVERAPTATHVQLLVETLLRGGPDGARRVEHLGVDRDAVGDPSSAAAQIERAKQCGIPDAGLWVAAIRVDLELGRFDDALERLEELDTTTRSSRTAVQLQLAVLDRRGRARGGHARNDARSMVAAFERLLEERPNDPGTRRRFVRHLAQLGEFHSARRVAWPGGPDVMDGATRPVSDHVELLRTAPSDWLYAVYAELGSQGRVREGHLVKRQLARNEAGMRVNRMSPVAHLVGLVQATCYANDAATAMKVLDRHPIALATEQERLIISKLRADLRLAQGEVLPMRYERRRRRPADLRFHQRFTEILRGAHVLVVGPAPSTRPSAHDLAGADVIVTTKRRWTDLDASTPTITYPSDASALLEATAMHTTLRSFEHHYVVVRPSLLAHGRSPLAPHPRLGVMQAEDSTTYFGTRFGIQRILYDLLGFETASIRLAGVDFFLGSESYVPGYANERAEIFEPLGLQPVESLAPHDFVGDFSFTRQLCAAGLVQPVAGLGALLDLGLDAYIDRLESVRSTAHRDPHRSRAGLRR